MVQAVKRTVRIQAGGRVEVVSADLPAGRDAEVIILVAAEAAAAADSVGLFADEPELIDQVVGEALDARQAPLRGARG